MDEQARRALLIGVGTTPEAAGHFTSLEQPVTADLRALTSSLRASGYEVEVLEEATRRDITARISAAARAVPAGGTLLVHFTGHGIRIGDIDYLVPHDVLAPTTADGTDDWQQPHITDNLVPADISRYLTHCEADTVLWTVDACRSPVPGDPSAWFGSRIVTGPPTGRFAFLAGCGAGQVSGHTAEGSFFSLGLAEALRPLTTAHTVEEVFAAAAAWTTRTAHRHGVRQEPTVRYGSDLEPETRATVICAGRRLLESWREAVRDCPLWARVPAAEAAEADRLRTVLEQLVDSCAQTVDQAQRRMPDPWADDEFPVRLLGRTLPLLLPGGAELSAVEAAALVAAPFLHEAAWANRMGAAREVRPWTVRVQEEGDARRRHYEQVAEHHPHIARKIKASFLREDSFEGTRNVWMWLVHRLVTEQFETDEHAVPPVYAEPFAEAVLGADGTGGTRVAEFSAAVREIASAVTLIPAEESVPSVTRVRTGTRGSRPVRTGRLAVLVHLAAALAFDVRTLPDVIAEHLGVSDGVLPQDVVAVVRDAEWYPEDDALHLDAGCPHPAVHAALAEATEQVDELACVFAGTARRLTGGDTDLLSGLPARMTSRGLRPLESRGRRAYDVPLLRFQLAQTEVRELLMGEQLYDGRRELALRELYQNAMDACRYRAMRWRYLRGKGHQPLDWEGRIGFVQGKDDRGPYVECRDTGVGMTVEQLKNTFTRAGRRFGQSRDFRREQEAWLRQDRSLRLHPNSRFGIGVFSYFMLADEMTIVTRPVDADGTVSPTALLVHISSSGSLFRIQEYDEPGDGMPEGGTRIRLHLRDSATTAGLSCVDLLRAQVVVSEFALDARDSSGASHTWQPGRLQPLPEVYSSVEAVPGTLWWVNGRGAVVCDGVRTDQKPRGYVLNLTGAHAGELSVNRTKLQNYDRAWEAEQWRAGAPALLSWGGLTMEWLWEMESASIRCARILWQALRGTGLRVPLTAEGRHVELDRVGWFSQDASFKGSNTSAPDDADSRSSRAWRAAALGIRSHDTGDCPPDSLAGHPVPEPGWGAIQGAGAGDWRRMVKQASAQRRTLADVVGIARALRVTGTSTAPPRSAVGDLAWTPKWPDVGIMNGLLSQEKKGYPFEKTLYAYQHDPDDLGGLVRASATQHLPLDELVARCARYTGLMPAPLPEVPEHHRGHVCDAADLGVLYLQVDKSTWRPARQPWDVTELAEGTGRSGRSPREISEHIGRFSWLGWPAHDWEKVLRWLQVPPYQRSFLTQFLPADATEEDLLLPWAATLAHAGELGLTLRKAERELGYWADHLGLSYQRRYTSKSAAGKLVPGEDTAAVVRLAHHQGVRLENGVSLRDLAYSQPHGLETGELAPVLRELGRAGVRADEGDLLLEAWEKMSHHQKFHFVGRNPSWVGADYPVLPTPDILFSAAEELKEPLGRTWKTARRLSKPLGLRMPELPDGLAETVPTWDECAALIDYNEDEEVDEWFEPPRWTPLTSSALIEYARKKSAGARDAYHRLSVFRAIGAQVPELSEDAVAGLPEAVPDARDALALSFEYRVSGPGTPLVPLDLVSIAARLGEPVRTTWQRVRPYLPLEAAPSNITSAPEVLPLWQDLILLSVHGDGLLPALTGVVEPGQVAFAARAVGESEDWVRERLEHYAELFELESKETEGKETPHDGWSGTPLS